jgi:hypothetical protein
VTFTEVLNAGGNDLTVTNTGKIDGDALALTRQVGDFVTEHIIAKRVPAKSWAGHLRSEGSSQESLRRRSVNSVPRIVSTVGGTRPPGRLIGTALARSLPGCTGHGLGEGRRSGSTLDSLVKRTSPPMPARLVLAH